MNWRSLFSWPNKAAETVETRDDPQMIDIDTWASMFGYGGFGHEFGPYSETGTSERIPNDFVGYINGAYKSSGAVFAVCLTRQLIFSEARFVLQSVDPDSDKPGDFVKDPRGILDILKKPWPNATAGELLMRAEQDTSFAGNFYAVREHVPGQGDRLRRLRPDWVTIVLSADPRLAAKSDIIGYVYKPGNTENDAIWEVYPIDGSNGAVVHWSPLPDPEAQYRGMSWLTPVIREIKADKAIAEHKLKYFENGGSPRMAVSINETVNVEEYAKFKKLFERESAGVSNAYKTLFLGGGADVSTVGANIQQLDFSTVTGIGETRICAAGRVHPAIVGLSEGMQGSSLNAGNFEAARNNLATGTMQPLWRMFCAALEAVLDLPPDTRLWFDDKDIAFLREDHEKVARRQQIQATTISRYIMQGYKPDIAAEAVIKDDLSILVGGHTGLYSVQLLPPTISFADANAAAKNGQTPGAPASKAPGGKTPSKANNTPTGSKRKPVGRPPKEQKDAWLDALERGEDLEDEK